MSPDTFTGNSRGDKLLLVHNTYSVAAVCAAPCREHLEVSDGLFQICVSMLSSLE
jgi:hypothetical protein